MEHMTKDHFGLSFSRSHGLTCFILTVSFKTTKTIKQWGLFSCYILFDVTCAF